MAISEFPYRSTTASGSFSGFHLPGAQFETRLYYFLIPRACRAFPRLRSRLHDIECNDVVIALNDGERVRSNNPRDNTLCLAALIDTNEASIVRVRCGIERIIFLTRDRANIILSFLLSHVTAMGTK